MRRLLFALGGLLAASVAAHATTLDWQITGPVTGSGSLAYDGSGNVTSFDGTVDGFSVSLIGGQPGGLIGSPSGAYEYDNIYYRMSNAPPVNGAAGGSYLDNYGVLLTGGGYGEINLWGNSSGNYSLSFGSDYTPIYTVNFDPVSDPVPEPGSAGVLIAGMAAMISGRRLLRRKAS